MAEDLSYEDAKSIVSYDALTGRFVWLVRDARFFTSERSCKAWNSRFAGKEAFNVPGWLGYRKSAIFGRYRPAHRIAWLLHYGRHPVGHIDHIDGDVSNNRIANLREVDWTENARNAKKKRNNTSGHTGVSFHKKRRVWCASIGVGGKSKFIGEYKSLEDAVAVRREMQKKLGFSDRHGL